MSRERIVKYDSDYELSRLRHVVVVMSLLCYSIKIKTFQLLHLNQSFL